MASEVVHTGLYRSRDAYIGGVCAGIAARLDFDPIVVRILAVLLAGMTVGLAVVAYMVLWVRLPLEPESTAPFDITPERAESAAHGSIDCALSLDSKCAGSRGDPERLSMVARLAIAVGLMLLFLAVAMNVAPIVSGTHWWQFWPLAFLIVGLCLIIIPVRTRFETLWHAVGIVVTSLSATLLPISLGVASWETFPYAFEHLWVFVVVALALFCLGLYNGSDVLVIAGAFCLAGFCLVALLAFSVPGDVSTLLITMPNGRAVRIAMLA